MQKSAFPPDRSRPNRTLRPKSRPKNRSRSIISWKRRRGSAPLRTKTRVPSRLRKKRSDSATSARRVAVQNATDRRKRLPFAPRLCFRDFASRSLSARTCAAKNSPLAPRSPLALCPHPQSKKLTPCTALAPRSLPAPAQQKTHPLRRPPRRAKAAARYGRRLYPADSIKILLPHNRTRG